MMCVREHWASGIAAWAAVLGLVWGSAPGRDVKLVVHPQKISAEAGKLALLPPAASRVDGDAVPWYAKAVKARPDKSVDSQIEQWLKMPLEQLPTDRAERALTLYLDSLKCVAQAVRCRECKWPASTDGRPVANGAEYRRLGMALGLWARYEIAQENYEGALLALRTGFGMGRHLMQEGPTLTDFLTGNMVAGVMCMEVGEFVQAAEAPNLYAALAALPRPLIDVEKMMESAKKAIPSEPPAGMTRAQFESELKRLQTTYDRTRIFVKHLDTDLAALQCVEATRSYAASHGGQLPQTLAEITEVAVPKDPMSGAAFRYTRAGATAVLESATPAGGNAKDVTRYEITVKN